MVIRARTARQAWDSSGRASVKPLGAGSMTTLAATAPAFETACFGSNAAPALRESSCPSGL